MTSEDAPLPNLWRTLRGFIEHLCVLMGLPQDLAARLWISRADHRFFAAALRPMEELLRRLIFLEVLDLEPEPAPLRFETKRRARCVMQARFGAAFDPERPDTWRTCFVIAPAARPARTGRSRRRTPPLMQIMKSAPLALRLEALIRGFNDTAPLARRLIRALQRAPTLVEGFVRQIAPHPLARPVTTAGKLCLERLRAGAAPTPAPDSS